MPTLPLYTQAVKEPGSLFKPDHAYLSS